MLICSVICQGNSGRLPLPNKRQKTRHLSLSQRAANLPEMQDKLQNLLHLLMVPHLHLFDFTSLNTNVKQFWELMHWHC